MFDIGGVIMLSEEYINKIIKKAKENPIKNTRIVECPFSNTRFGRYEGVKNIEDYNKMFKIDDKEENK